MASHMQSKSQAAAAVIVIWQLHRNVHTRHIRSLLSEWGSQLPPHYRQWHARSKHQLLTSRRSNFNNDCIFDGRDTLLMACCVMAGCNKWCTGV